MIKLLIDSQRWLSRSFDRCLPAKYTLDGNKDYLRTFVPKYLRKGLKIYDVGGGKNPYLGAENKKIWNATVVGLDIDKKELDEAPEGAYDETICADITAYRGDASADMVICQALLEHVKDTEKALAAISTILKPGGRAVIFVPSRNSVYSKLNRMLPQNLKRHMLDTLYPGMKKKQGFPAYYHKCTPSEFRAMAENSGLFIVGEKFYYSSDYFSFCFPVYLVWRLLGILCHCFCGERSAETFSMAFEKR